MAGLLPLLFLIYLGLPVLLPTTVTAPLYPKGAPVFVALLIFLAFIELAGFYIIYSDVLGHMQRNLDDELERLRASGARADTIVEELRLANFRLREMSHTDELTEVGNRRSFDLRVREEISRSSRFGHSFSLLMIDIDGFKKFNDEFGHPKGDAVLRALGRADAVRVAGGRRALPGGRRGVRLHPARDRQGRGAGVRRAIPAAGGVERDGARTA